ncbi:hypothetical protein Hs30E_09070 [Lactococcus hodotermopsidis]|uniref:Uncharacterized protein n=1 Tax=Pseudolactococcus hodotermopsidis TaxID=2709157 RepID=A0A6A0BBZ1_9LACT|nr:hypothetical protein [Lactococcus hodotermopsidis]GFH42356.1 hypothetical protein Hs30E_09070 [Lactococcus hodotermopsidis]
MLLALAITNILPLLFAIYLIVKKGKRLAGIIWLLLVLIDCFNLIVPHLFLPLTIWNVILGNSLKICLICLSDIQKKTVVRTSNQKGATEDIVFKGSLILNITLGIFVLTMLATFAATFLSAPSQWRTISTNTTDSLPQIDSNQTKQIGYTVDVARAKMNKAFGEVPNASQFELGTVTAQFYQGKPVYIAPVEQNSFFSSLRNHETPGYFMIDAANISASATFVKKNLKYTDHSLFAKNTGFKLFAAAPDKSVRSTTFEIDDKGTPYFVSARGALLAGVRDNQKTREIVVLNAENGHTATYTAKTLPKWVNGVVDAESAAELLQQYGENKYLVNFSKKDKMLVNDNGSDNGVSPVFTSDGNIYYTADFTTPKSKANSILAYGMVDARTNVLSIVKSDEKNKLSLVGLTDSDAAILRAEKLDPSLKLKASNPALFMVENTPVWVLSMTDSADNFHDYVYVNAQNTSVIARGNDAKTALASYMNVLSLAPSSNGNVAGKEEEVTGVVTRFALDNGKVYLMLDVTNMQYQGKVEDFPYLATTEVGDTVTMTANKMTETAVVATITKFENEDLK